MATHSTILAWRIPWTGKPGRLQSMESQRVGQDLAAIQMEILICISLMLSSKTGDGKSECRHSRNQRTKMDWNG